MNEPTLESAICQHGIAAEPKNRCRLRATHKARWQDGTVRTYCRGHASAVGAMALEYVQVYLLEVTT